MSWSKLVSHDIWLCFAPQCIPLRAGLLTGLYQQRFGLDENATIPLSLEEILIPQRLKKAGYVSGMTGNWHLEPNRNQGTWIKENMPEKIWIEENVPESFVKKVILVDIPFSMKCTLHAFRAWS
jgi:hypothetical protein